YCHLYKASKYGIERLEFFDNEDEANSCTSGRFITLENCVKIIPDPQKLQPNVVTRTTSYHFASVEDNEMPEWLSAFQSVAFKEGSNTQSIEEDNELYCPSGEGLFSVELVQSEVSSRCGLDPGPYTLLLTSSAIQLRDSKEQQLLFTWPYLYIRKYGYRDGKFTFEAGRKCETGEGEFQLKYSNQQEIYRCLSLKMKSMRKLLGGEIPSSSSIFCSDSSNQFQAALSMEARSRSPLPPSPNTSTNILDLDLNGSSQFKSVDCLSNGQFNTGPPLKPKATSYNSLFHSSSFESPPLPFKQKSLISPTSETNSLNSLNAPPYLHPKSSSVSQNSLDKINSRKSPNLFRATLVDIDIHESPESQGKYAESLVAPPLKPKPMKPPRKNIFISSSQKCANEEESGSKRFYRQKNDSLAKQDSPMSQQQNCLSNLISTDVSNSTPPYDEVEIRHEAWKTLGVDEMTHTERPFSQIINSSDSSLDYEILDNVVDDSKLMKENENDKMAAAATTTNGGSTSKPCQKFMFLPIKPASVSGNYDTLQHFGSTLNKTNGKSGYKQIIINHSNSSPSSPSPTTTITTDTGYSLLENYANSLNHTFHDYDEVDERPIETFRMADDSHLGYGVIRKKPENQIQNDLLRLPPKHKVYNNMEYAVITKSKHV
ncbi:Docking protein, putative, partial [Pediculus humanus corporis]